MKSSGCCHWRLLWCLLASRGWRSLACLHWRLAGAGDGAVRGDSPSNIISSPLENSEFSDPDRLDATNEAMAKYCKKMEQERELFSWSV